MLDKVKPCRCGSEATQPKVSPTCEDRWTIKCTSKRCSAKNCGQGLKDTIEGWNRLASGFYR